jgi:hypothetical protein
MEDDRTGLTWSREGYNSGTGLNNMILWKVTRNTFQERTPIVTTNFHLFSPGVLTFFRFLKAFN